eukprot:2702812-Rhodomonas_salina.2
MGARATGTRISFLSMDISRVCTGGSVGDTTRARTFSSLRGLRVRAEQRRCSLIDGAGYCDSRCVREAFFVSRCAVANFSPGRGCRPAYSACPEERLS